MDRKYCILLYSLYSSASKDLIDYLKSIPVDFSSITGLTIVNIDNDEFKTILRDNGIEYVPTILIEYYDGKKQKLVDKDIYLWIHQMIQMINNRPFQEPEKSHQYAPTTKDRVEHVDTTKDSVEEKKYKNAQEKKSDEISSAALQLQQSRDQFLEKNKPTFSL